MVTPIQDLETEFIKDIKIEEKRNQAEIKAKLKN